MTNRDDLIQDALDALIPVRPSIKPDWADVLKRSEAADLQSLPARPPAPLHGHEPLRPAARRAPRRRQRRIYVVAAAVMIALALAAFAVAAAEGWWFFQSNAVPRPASAVIVVGQGAWDGQQWQLAAYRTASGEICVSLTPTGPSSTAATFSCTDIGASSSGVGVLALGTQPTFPAYVVGPVAVTAATVRLATDDGRTIETPTLPAQLGVRFYATDVPCGSTVTRIEAFNAAGARIGMIKLSDRNPTGARDDC